MDRILKAALVLITFIPASNGTAEEVISQMIYKMLPLAP
jgi:hypothetical protein